MSDYTLEKNGFTFIWKIKNYSMYALPKTGYLESPKFLVEMLSDSEWRIKLYPKNKNFEDCIGVNVEKVSGAGKTSVGISLSLLTSEGPFFLDVEEKRKFSSNDYMYKYFKDIKHENIIKDGSTFLPNDTLTLQCHLWNGATATLPSVKCSAVTHIGIERRVFRWSLECFSSPAMNKTMFITVPSSSNETPNFDMKLQQFEKNMYIAMHIFNANEQRLYLVRTKISVVSSNGDLTNTSENVRLILPSDESWCLWLKFGRKKLLQDKELYLPKDVLTLHCEFAISTSEVWTQLEECNYVPELWEGKEKVCSDVVDETTPGMGNSRTYEEGILSLRNDFSLLLSEKKLCDVILRTEAKEFPVHKAILCARSPVFCSMFESDMKEKQSGIVDIDDIDAETLDIFLKYLYLGAMDDLKWEAAVPLYSAADKYQILTLKKECSSFLSAKLSAENVCSVLILADMHQDDALKQTAQEIFCAHSKTVLLSKEWISLLQQRSELAADVLRVMALKMQ